MPEYTASGRSSTTVSRTPASGRIIQRRITCTWAWPPPTSTSSARTGWSLRCVATYPSATSANATTRARGCSGCSSGSWKRQNAVPKGRPSVSSQFGTPGSRCAITMR